jgi:hypothetical protein
MNWRGYDIEIPKGTPVTSQTACGFDEKYNFVNSFGWIPKNMPLLLHDAIHYGIDIPAELLEPVNLSGIPVEYDKENKAWGEIGYRQ